MIMSFLAHPLSLTVFKRPYQADMSVLGSHDKVLKTEGLQEQLLAAGSFALVQHTHLQLVLRWTCQV